MLICTFTAWCGYITPLRIASWNGNLMQRFYVVTWALMNSFLDEHSILPQDKVSRFLPFWHGLLAVGYKVCFINILKIFTKNLQ